MGVGSVGSQRRGARSYTCGLRSDPQALGRGAHIRVDLSQPPDKSRLRIFDPDHRSVDLCDDDPTDAQKASEGHRVRASQTSSTAVFIIIEPVGLSGIDRLLAEALRVCSCKLLRIPTCLPLTTGSMFMTLAVVTVALGTMLAPLSTRP